MRHRISGLLDRSRQSLLLILVVMTLTAGCYLPQATTTDQPVEDLVRITVSTCTAQTVGGGARNDADIPVRVQVRAKWLDGSSTRFNEEQTQIERIAPGEQVEWQTQGGDDDLETPVFCEAEAQVVEEFD